MAETSLLRRAEHTVIFFANGHGDAFISLPAIRAIVHNSAGRVSLVTNTRCLFLWRDLPLRKIYTAEFPRSSHGRKIAGLLNLAGQVEAADLFVSLVPWISQDLLALAGYFKCAVSIGWGSEWSIPITHVSDPHSSGLPRRILEILDPEIDIRSYEYPVRYENKLSAIEHLISKPTHRSQVVVLHADTSVSKSWPLKSWKYLLTRLQGRGKKVDVFIVGLNDIGWSEYLDLPNVHSFLGAELEWTCCLLSRANVFVGIDSVFLHVADNARVPVVALFGPTTPEEFGPRFSPHVVFRNSSVLSMIEPEAVYEVLSNYLESRQGS